MIRLRRSMRAFALGMAFVMLMTSLPINIAVAAMVTIDQAIAQTEIAGDRDRVLQFMARQEVRQQLQSLGVDPDEAARRAAGMSDDEIRQVAGRLETLPAGQGVATTILGIILLLLLVLLLTDLFGVTDVFPFIDSRN